MNKTQRVEELPTTIYTPDPATLKPIVMIKQMFADLLESRELAWRLAVRDISAQYRQSFLGYIWAFLLPLLNTAAWLFLNASGIVQIADTDIPYPVYVFTGTMLWQIFTEALQSPLQQISGSKGMLAKLNFPRESLILAGMLKSLFNAAIKILILVPAILLMGVYPNWYILLFPVALVSILFVGNTIGFYLSPLGVLYTDVGKAVPVLTQFAMYITPVVFAMPTTGFAAKVFELNFMTPLILTARYWLTGNHSEWLIYFIGVNVVAIFLFLLGWIIFRITMPVLIERMSA
jgi:lipopolysaccharide transport system permease protein